jgi:HEPN domain-containing protein
LSSTAAEGAGLRAEVGEWLAIAGSDAAAARVCLASAESLLGIAAYHCQQAAEKVMKAALIVHGKPFRRTHDLDELATQVAEAWPAAAALVEPLRPLTFWGFAYRYPMQGLDEEPPRPADVEAALGRIESLKALVEAGLPPV